jgi:hypothetical protein
MSRSPNPVLIKNIHDMRKAETLPLTAKDVPYGPGLYYYRQKQTLVIVTSRSMKTVIIPTALFDKEL